jgi:hypothetical protein
MIIAVSWYVQEHVIDPLAVCGIIIAIALAVFLLRK